jgi:hypothetical protein
MVSFAANASWILWRAFKFWALVPAIGATKATASMVVTAISFLISIFEWEHMILTLFVSHVGIGLDKMSFDRFDDFR